MKLEDCGAVVSLNSTLSYKALSRKTLFFTTILFIPRNVMHQAVRVMFTK